MSFDQAEVVRFYEKHPYPYRPAGHGDDSSLIGIPSDIRFINHFIFSGTRDFTRPFRVLVAGGGTGDAVIGLGRQLALMQCPAELDYIDLSAKSREIAEGRARDLGLVGARFHTGRIQDLPELAPGPYDYIDFCGVINHVGDQEEVLGVLAGLLAPGGGIGVMAYGQLGRTGVYHVQDMLRQAGAGQDDIGLARALLSALPETNWHQRNAVFHNTAPEPDVEIADRYLNPSDRAFDVAELRDLARGAGMKIAAFAPPLMYDPVPFLEDPELRRRIAALPWIERCIFAEKFNGDICMHNFYMVAEATVTRPDALLEAKNAIPIMISVPAGQAPQIINGGFGITMRCGPLVRKMTLPGTDQSPHILRAIDGQKTLQQIHRSMPDGLSWRAFQREFALVYRGLNGVGEMVLSTTPIPR